MRSFAKEYFIAFTNLLLPVSFLIVGTFVI